MNSRRSYFTMFLAFVLGIMIAFPSCSAGLKVPDLYKYDDFSEFIKLGNYKNLEYELVNDGVTSEDIQKYVDDARSQFKETTEVKSGTVQSDSIAYISYVGTVDGVAFEGGSSDGMDVDIDNSNFIDGFAEGLIGRSVGETFDLHVTFPDDYGVSELAGKPAIFKTTIISLKEEKLPEYNDEFVQKISEYTTIAEFEKYVKKLLSKDKKEQARSKERSDVFEQILKSSEVIKYPEKELENANNNQEQVKAELVLHAIAKLEGIEITNQDYSDFVDKLLADAGITAEEFENDKGISIEKYAEQNNLFVSLLYECVMDNVMNYSIAK